MCCVIKRERAETVTNLFPFTHSHQQSCSMELLTRPSIMLSRHIICVCLSVRLCEFQGLVVKMLPRTLWCAQECTFVFLRIENCPCVCVRVESELHPCWRSGCNTLSLQPVARSHVVNRQRSFPNVWTSVPLFSPGKQWSFLLGQGQTHVSQLVFIQSSWDSNFFLYKSLQCFACL